MADQGVQPLGFNVAVTHPLFQEVMTNWANHLHRAPENGTQCGSAPSLSPHPFPPCFLVDKRHHDEP